MIEVVAGAGLGMLLGLLIGLAQSPVVGSVVAAMVAVALSWITLWRDKKEKLTSEDRKASGLRVASFSSNGQAAPTRSCQQLPGPHSRCRATPERRAS